MALLDKIHACVGGGSVPEDLLALDSMVTDCNAVLFDVANDFAGCIPGCHEVLRRQGLLRSVHCLDPREVLSPGQAAAIDRLYATYPDLTRRRLRGGELAAVAGVGRNKRSRIAPI